MTRATAIRPEFVERIPKALEVGVLYISEKYSTAAHSCCCGCETKIVTPLKAGRWQLVKSRRGVSLYPSIGNWSAACQSHYWIRDDRVQWERAYTPAEIAINRANDKRALANAYAQRQTSRLGRLWDRIKRWF